MSSISNTNPVPNNYSSYTTKYNPRASNQTDSDRSLKYPKLTGHGEKLRTIPYQREDSMVNFRLRLLKVYRKMSRSDIYYFHHQMRRYFPHLTDDVQEPDVLFSLLIKKGLIGPDNIQLLVESFFALKRHELISLLTGDKQNTPPKPETPVVDDQTLTDQFVLKFCTEEIGPDELWQLGVKGFKLPFIVIQRAQYDSKTTLDATLSVFSQWKQQAPNTDASRLPADAMPSYSTRGLANALRDAQLNYAWQKYFSQ